MSYYTEKIITPRDFENRTFLQTTITIERSNEVLLTGTIYNSCCEPLEGAIVQIFEICGRNHRVDKGFVITNQYGEFAIVVTKNNYINYQLDVYEPLMTG